MTKPIVVGVDLLEPSRVALERAIPIARRRGAELVMAHVAPVPESARHFEYSRRGIVERYRKAASAQLQSNRDALGELRERYSGRGVTISQSVVSGPPASGLLEVAEELDAQLIVVGSFGRRGLDRFLLGSVAERICNQARVDVMVVRATRPSINERLLVPIDFSEASGRVLQVAEELASGSSPLTLLHCFDVPSWIDEQFPRPTLAEVESMVTQRLEDIAQALRDDGLSVDTEVRRAEPKSHIVELAETHSLVVLGSHGRHGLRRFFIGSVASKTVRHAACSVYIVRPAPLATGRRAS